MNWLDMSGTKKTILITFKYSTQMPIYIMKLSDFDYNLPKELIAQKPADKRDESRLMVVRKGKKGKIDINNNNDGWESDNDCNNCDNKIIIEHKHFYDIVDYLKEGDVLVVNDTKVLPFKFHGRKETGGKAEMILGNKIVDGKYYKKDKNRYECRIKTTKARIGTVLIFEDKTNYNKSNYGSNNNVDCDNNYNKDNDDDNKYQKEKLHHETGWSMPRPNKDNKIKSCLKIKATVVDKINDKYIIEFDEDYSVEELSEIGEMPLPPYIKDFKGDVSRYQTVYSKYYQRENDGYQCEDKDANKNKKNHIENSGSIAAPTAGLHFTDELLEKLRNKGVKIVKICLHVSFGTFIPVRNEDITKHKMEAEYYIVDENSANIINSRKFIDKKGKEKTGRLFVVGTTALKTLETVADEKGIIHAKEGWSNLFIYPSYKFKVKADGFITNFHLPTSTLIMLVSAFFGREEILDAYNIAVKEKYRFFSFGDAMMLMR